MKLEMPPPPIVRVSVIAIIIRLFGLGAMAAAVLTVVHLMLH